MNLLRLTTIAATVAIGAVVALPAAANEGNREAYNGVRAKRLAKDVGTFRQTTWACQDKLIGAGVLDHRTKASVSIWALPHSIGYRVWTSRTWQHRLAGCTTVLKQHTLPNTNDWQTAVRIAQRPYPGTADRSLAISDHEGGAGPWVWWGGRPWGGYHIGNDPWGDDTVGGWVQFRYSTFIVYWPSVVADLKHRGYVIPDLGWARPHVLAGASTGYGPWLSPLGQALTVGYMHYYRKQGSHWAGA